MTGGSPYLAMHYYGVSQVFSVYQSAQDTGSTGASYPLFSSGDTTSSWLVALGANTNNYSTSPQFTVANRFTNVGSPPGTGNYFTDSNGVVGSGSIEVDFPESNLQLFTVLTFLLTPWQNPNVTDTTAVSDTVAGMQLNPVHINVTDTTAVTATVTIDNNAPPGDILSTLVSSGYKWLTSTLQAAQQAFAVRPYFTCQIIDDTIQPLAQLFNGAGNPLGRGSMAVAPDGTMLAAGFDNSGHVAFWKAPDLNAVAGAWPTKVTLDSGGTISSSTNQVAMSVSDYFNGSYQIDIWYFSNFGNDATNIVIKNQYSTDGGSTWTARTFNPASMPNTSYPTDNISIAAMQDININGVMYSGCFYIKPNANSFVSGFVGYDVYYIWGNVSGFTTDVLWSAVDVNSSDWTIHSISAFYLKSTQYLVFSGIRNILDSPGGNQNFSIWVSAIENVQSSVSLDLWTPPVAVMPIGSTNSLNQNAFTNPMATVVNGMAYIVMMAKQVDSVSQTAQGSTSSVVTTHTNYMLIQSDDGKTFSYPSIFVYTDGTEFNSSSVACFVPQAAYWYLGGGNGYLWQFTQNNTVADVSNDVIGYSITEQAGQPSSISLKVGNQNNKWFGTSPTSPGAAAITRNKKVALYQGYYNSSGVTETVPRNVYFIDDIQQQVSGTTNDLLIVGRDLYKKMKTTVTRFNYQFVGPFFYTDIFDGTTNQNWNQIAGGWTFQPTINAVDGLGAGVEADMMLSNVQIATFGHTMRVFFLNTQEGTVYAYAMYVDANNWVRCEIDTFHNTWAITQNVAGTPGTIDSGSLPTAMTNNVSYMILIKRFGYWNFNFIFSPSGGAAGNDLTAYNPSTQSFVLRNGGTGEYSLASVVASNTSMQGAFSVGIGASASTTQRFRYFQLAVYNNSNNVGEVARAFARLAAIFSFKIVYTFRELLFTSTQFNGTFSVANRVLSLEATNTAVSSINSMSNGEITFQAKIATVSGGSAAGFRFLFRSDSATSPANAYYFHLLWNGQTGGSQLVTCRFERLSAGTSYVFYNSTEDASYNGSFSNTCDLNIDPTIYHTFRIVMINGQLTAFVDDVMVASWNDDNTTLAYLTSGFWGFTADTNTALFAQEIKAPTLWKPVPSVSYNPGDDIESDITALATSLLFWVFSDLFGRFKSTFLNSSDSSMYTYNNQLYQQNVDQSDKEYVSQVTVYGSGVSATARNTTLMAGVTTRDLVIVDYTILTQADAQTRANNELTNANQYLNQNSATQVINVGAELYDVVTVINTGNNTSGVNGATRVYDQTFTQGGGDSSSDYSLEIGTGNV